ncbi:DEAD/DEAH box helicase [Paracoccus hibiscisoli]|uniref:DEAD-box ATP-dependent RNA helicase RhpA n=1 Tax=Paracoccus hibiscisoli TaxID=2023261 RepID=A0A4U0QSF5_9RHOB|nr:DEAD/DEAH box helicase [Paracoccus hibiscisoli]
MTKFSDLKLDPKVLQAVLEAGYETPTPIQMGAIPPALEGRDVLGIAQTGTGKTASFTLPMITLLGRGRARARMPRSLVLCPTRELAAQVAENFDTYAKHTRLTKALLIGGVSFGEQDKLIDRGVDVLIATPGRLLDHVERGKLLLTGVQIMVVDEADRMLDMGFIPDIERIFQLTPFTRQTLFFSATMAPEIERITNTFLHSPERIEVARQASASETITQRLIQLTPTRRDMAAKQKRDLLRALVDAEGDLLTNAIVFCNRKTDVDILAKSLAKHGYDAAPIHGDLDQSQRTRTLESFRDGKLRLLIASDVAARGLDIPAVSHVFNYDLPSHAEDYVHRIGRTGRAGRLGTSISIATPSDDKYLTAIEQLLKKSLPRVDAPAGFAASDTPAREERKAEDTSDERKPTSRSRSRRRGGSTPAPEAAPVEAPVAEQVAAPVVAEARPEPKPAQPRREESRREESRREEPRREEARREEPRREEGRRDERRGDRRDGRRGRDQDGRGSQVLGMGDHVPQFMLVELRSIGLSDDAPSEARTPVAEAPVSDAQAPEAAEATAKPARRSRGRGRGKAQADQPVDEARTAPVTDATEVAEAPAAAETQPVEAPVTEEAAPAPKRRRSRKTAEAEAPTPDATEEAAAKPKRTRSRKAAEPTEAPTADAEAPKPTRRRKAATPAPDAEAAPAEDKPKRTRRKKADPDTAAAKDADAQA